MEKLVYSYPKPTFAPDDKRCNHMHTALGSWVQARWANTQETLLWQRGCLYSSTKLFQLSSSKTWVDMKRTRELVNQAA